MTVAYKFNDLITAHVDSLDPTPNYLLNIIDNDDKTVVTSNCSASPTTQNTIPTPGYAPNIALTVRMLLGNPLHGLMNALTIESTHAIADTGATSIFIMENADVVNKRSPRGL